MNTKTANDPLFYSDLQPLTLTAHRDWRLLDGDAGFTRGALGVPVVLGEFADASRNYALVFAAGEEGSPVALTGLDDGNLFVTDGSWDSASYIPAYVRRHPFLLASISADQPEELALGIDAGSKRFAAGGTAGVALFDGEEPSELTRGAMEFCSNYTAQAMQTREFRDALRAKGLLVDRRLDFTLPGDKKFSVDGFQIIDAEKFTQLDAATIVEWHPKGWLAAAYYHLASLNRVNELLDRRARRTPAT
jgi:hypothetical protein